jgi:fibulin 1/2
VITTDGKQTYALFNYPSDGLQWSGRGSTGVVGYTTHDASFFSRHFLSGFPQVVNIATQRYASNVDTTGRLFYRVSRDSNICSGNSVCLDWYFDDISRNSFWTFFLPPCPCSEFQARLDNRFRPHFSITGTCFVATFASLGFAQTECCYGFSGQLLLGSPQGGTANRYHSFFVPSLHFEFDIQPYVDCCLKADLCPLYYLRRPSRNCFGYLPPFFAWLWGDPHISTLDGKQYTFNGIGEYILMKTVNESFVLEGRTRLVP